tara:strand:+ start:224 stop:955 length:732 start_codon:yes stop_codon:yes gene_type:complete
MPFKISKKKIFFLIYIFVFISILIIFLLSFKSHKEFFLLKTNFVFIKEFSNQYKSFTIILFLFFSIIWIILLGIVTPIMIFAILLFDNLITVYLIVFTAVITGSILTFLISKYFFYNYFNRKYKKYLSRFDFLFLKYTLRSLFIFRLMPGIPFPIKNIIPSLYKIKLKNFIVVILLVENIPIVPNIFLLNGLENALLVQEFSFKNFFDLKIILPLFLIIIIGIFIKTLYKNLKLIKLSKSTKN